MWAIPDLMKNLGGVGRLDDEVHDQRGGALHVQVGLDRV